MYFLDCFSRVKLILTSLVLFFMVGCQGGVNNGTSSHVATGAESRVFTSAQPQAFEPTANQPKAAVKPKAVVPAETNVQVLAANPQEGIPLGDDTNVQVDSIKPAAQPKQTPKPALITAVPAKEEKAETAAETSWLDRYPNLSEDLKDYQQIVVQLEQEAKAYQERVTELKQKVNKQWRGAPMITSSAHQFVKYTDSYQSRGAMDFDEGKIVVETVDQANPKQHLKEAIITTLLTPYDAENPEIYSDKKINYEGPALLAGQVVDHEGQPVKWEWRAERYAEHLVNNSVQQLDRNGQVVYRVEIPLVANHTQVRGHQYEHLVRTAAQRYGIDETLIYSIMETESHFNPYATSHIPAYGLMQVVPSTAGKDVFTRIKKRNDQPSRNYLFNPANNIDTGTAYLSILRDNYLKGIRHPLSKEYAMISGYNGGAGNVLRTFHRDRKQAINVINQLSPQQVYDRLHLKHPRAEARGYIRKVTEAQQRYRVVASVDNPSRVN
ncbi:membrane-bound lytic murein transglycosylase MltC [Marinospirillum insulare]|uniref:Membrane-bound lytic murein transglycosylase C n=1 Tax=Marinospirillum insulare TaxID=217169 RepID=A0ABQ6A0H3_9GAMM|nr:membrane-bound lytic murein transglycosylase MltC [Marinospirillum insulare]GLR64770.1 hypothetical protein GCM10007878_22080 [Marinospirillum insulare]